MPSSNLRKMEKVRYKRLWLIIKFHKNNKLSQQTKKMIKKLEIKNKLLNRIPKMLKIYKNQRILRLVIKNRRAKM